MPAKPIKLSRSQRDFLLKYILKQSESEVDKKSPSGAYATEKGKYKEFLAKQTAVSAALDELKQLSQAPETLDFIKTTKEEIHLADPAAALEKSLQDTLGKEGKEQKREDTKAESKIIETALGKLDTIQARIDSRKKEMQKVPGKGEKEDAFFLYIASSGEYEKKKTEQEKAAYIEEKRKRYAEYQRAKERALTKFDALPGGGVTEDDIQNTDPLKNKKYTKGAFQAAIDALGKLDGKMTEALGKSVGKDFSKHAEKINSLLEKIKKSSAYARFAVAYDDILLSEDSPAKKPAKLSTLAENLNIFVGKWETFHKSYYIQTDKLAKLYTEFKAVTGMGGTLPGVSAQLQKCYQDAHDAPTIDALQKAIQDLENISSSTEAQISAFTTELETKRKRQFSNYEKLYKEKTKLLAGNLTQAAWHEKSQAAMTEARDLAMAMKYADAVDKLNEIKAPTPDEAAFKNAQAQAKELDAQRKKLLQGIQIEKPDINKAGANGGTGKERRKLPLKTQERLTTLSPVEDVGAKSGGETTGDTDIEKALRTLEQLNYKRSQELAARKRLKLQDVETAIEEEKENAVSQDAKKNKIEVFKKEIEKYFTTFPGLRVSVTERIKELGAYYINASGKEISESTYTRLLALKESISDILEKYKNLEAFIDKSFKKPDTYKSKLKTGTADLQTVAGLDEHLDTYEQTLIEDIEKINSNTKLRKEFDEKCKEAEAKLSECGIDSGIVAWSKEKLKGNPPAYLTDLSTRLKALKASAETDVKQSLAELNAFISEIYTVAADPSKLIEAEATIRRNEIETEHNKKQWDLDKKEYALISEAAKKAKADAADLKTMQRMREQAESAKNGNDYVTAFQLLSQATEYGRRLTLNPLAAVLMTSRNAIPASIGRYTLEVEKYKTTVAKVIADVNQAGKDEPSLAESSQKAITRLAAIMDCFDAATAEFTTLKAAMSDKKLASTTNTPERNAKVRELREEGLALVRHCEATLNGHPTIRQFSLCPLPARAGEIEKRLTGLAESLNQLYGNLLVCAK